MSRVQTAGDERLDLGEWVQGREESLGNWGCSLERLNNIRMQMWGTWGSRGVPRTRTSRQEEGAGRRCLTLKLGREDLGLPQSPGQV